MAAHVTVHRFQASLFPVNAYIIETPSSVSVVDATLGVTDGRKLRATVDALGKPLAGVVVTHAHPDHYGGVAPLLGDERSGSTPIVAVHGVAEVIRRDDEVKEQILRPMFGDEWPVKRAFPNRTVAAGDVTLSEATFTVVDAGPCESPHDSWWLLDTADGPCAFVGDLVYSHMHAYLADGFSDEWLVNLERAKRALPKDVRLFMGHGEPSRGLALLDQQAEYIKRFLAAVKTGLRSGQQGDALADAVMTEMKKVLPADDLSFLARLSVPAVAERLSPISRSATSG